MDIIVNDTNIFIDLLSVGLLDKICELPYEIHTVDFIIGEIIQENQLQQIMELVNSYKIHIHSFSSADVASIATEYATIRGNLSFVDVAVCYYARSGSYKLITGDRQLRKYAECSKIEVHGILYIIDEMIANDVISKREGILKLRNLMAINTRLPKSAITSRIDDWSK